MILTRKPRILFSQAKGVYMFDFGVPFSCGGAADVTNDGTTPEINFLPPALAY